MNKDETEFQYKKLIEIEIDDEFTLVYDLDLKEWYYRFVSSVDGEESKIDAVDEDGDFIPICNNLDSNKFEEIKKLANKNEV